MSNQPHERGESLQQQYALKFPEPIKLWKWAARNSRRADGKILAMADFFKRAVRAVDQAPGEPHPEFVRRALLTETRELIKARKAAGGIVPLWVEELLAAEITQS